MKVTGVSDGTTTYDAVNFGQLRQLDKVLSRGIAASTAAANIPALEGGKEFAAGVGLGTFRNETAVAAGVTYRFAPTDVIRSTLGINVSGGNDVNFGIGAGWSW